MGFFDTLFKGTACSCAPKTRKHARTKRARMGARRKSKTYRGGYINPENSSAAAALKRNGTKKSSRRKKTASPKEVK